MQNREREREGQTYIKVCVLFNQPTEVVDDGLSPPFNLVKLIFKFKVKLRPTTQEDRIGHKYYFAKILLLESQTGKRVT